jgi:hypothetical protein
VNEDDEWAHDRLLTIPVLEECSARRATIGGITHRIVDERAETMASTGWMTLCGHRLQRRRPHSEADFSDGPVDCMACIGASG